MSRFLRSNLEQLSPYVPGEQPQGKKYIKLNTNESPYPPSPRVLKALEEQELLRLNLYPDPLAKKLRDVIGKAYDLSAENIFVGNGSDEVLGFAFMAYVGEGDCVLLPQISYGFYKVYARLQGAKAKMVPLREDFTLPVDALVNAGMPVVLANPNAPTGLALSLCDIERIVASNSRYPVVVDEAYVDFGGESALPLLRRYDNLLITRTYSKSRSLAGGRLGYAMANPDMIADLERVKGSFHPYSVNSLTMAAGIAAMEDHEYFERNVAEVCKQREEIKQALRKLSFHVTDSCGNFLLAAPPNMDGQTYYQLLKERGILVRYLSEEALKEYVRISIGTKQQMEQLLRETEKLIGKVHE